MPFYYKGEELMHGSGLVWREPIHHPDGGRISEDARMTEEIGYPELDGL